MRIDWVNTMKGYAAARYEHLIVFRSVCESQVALWYDPMSFPHTIYIFLLTPYRPFGLPISEGLSISAFVYISFTRL